MGVEIELKIPRSSSPSLPLAMATAREFENFDEPTDSKKPCVLTVGQDELQLRHHALATLYETVRGWKGAQLTINGRLADRQAFRAVAIIFECSEKRTAAVIPRDFCEAYGSGWGCRHLRAIQEGLPSSLFEMNRGVRYWFQFGHFDDDRAAWILDKVELQQAIGREAASTFVDLCPFYSADAVQHRVESLPDSLELGDDSSWEMVFEDKYSGSTIAQIPVCVKPKKLPGYHGFGISIGLDGDEADSQEKAATRSIPEVSFEDVGGIDDIVSMIREVIELPLKHPALFQHLGISPHKGILLYGPPGCGKTLLAKAIANDIGAHFIPIGGPEVLSKWFGQSEENLRAVFAEARSQAPSVIFFDEFDSLAQKRSGDESVRFESVVVNQLLTLMDGMETYENVCVVASTNRPELLDPAVMRPGRFDYLLEIKHPGPDGVRKILGIHSRGMPLGKSVDLNTLANQMNGLTGAEIAFVAREAAYNCLRRSADPTSLLGLDESDIALERFEVEQEDFQVALATVTHNHEEPPHSADAAVPRI
jgi:ATP-dependent 26S proteasome regulatory subunit